jgi:predicted permease
VAADVSANFFQMLGVAPQMGRWFAEDEDRSGHDHEVILSNSLWRRRFGSDPSIIGRKLTLRGAPYTVVGVLPDSFRFPKEPEDLGHRVTGAMEIFRPLGYSPDDTVPHAGDLNFQGIARLKPGVSREQARADLTAVESAIDKQVSDAWTLTPLIEPLQQSMTGDVRQSLVVLMCAVGVVLLVLCVNLANLSLARAAGRAREAAIRTSLGASRWDLMRQSLAESGLLALAGGVFGILVAKVGLKSLIAAAPVDLPRLSNVTLDMRVLVFAILISLATGVLFGILPALRSASSGSPFETLKSASSANTAGRAGLRIRNLLVSFEVGLCAALLVTAGLFLGSFVRLTTIDKGFNIQRVLAVDMALPGTKYAKDQDRVRFFDRVLSQAKALPGVESAAISSYLPLQGESWIDIVRTEHDSRPDSQLPAPNLRFVSPGYFRTLEIPLHAGRDFEATDQNRVVAVISESLARKLWPDTNAVGRRMIDHNTVHEVIGVVGDARSTALDQKPVDMLYIPMWQRPQFSSSILVRTAMDPTSIAAAVRAGVWSVDGDVPVPRERTLAQIMSESVARRRFQMMLVLLFALAALGLAAFGTYGVVSYTVTRRRAEMGIRIALGAGRADVMRLVFQQGMTPVFAGLAAGAVAALWIGKYVASLLFSVSPRDPLAFSVAAGVLILVAAAACWIPARRATRVNPIEALRFE